MRYRVKHGRWDDPDSSQCEFEAVNDEAAKEQFKLLSAQPSNAWDLMSLERVDVVEKTTRLAINENLKKFISQ
jgi:hypothetical protein